MNTHDILNDLSDWGDRFFWWEKEPNVNPTDMYLSGAFEGHDSGRQNSTRSIQHVFKASVLKAGIRKKSVYTHTTTNGFDKLKSQLDHLDIS